MRKLRAAGEETRCGVSWRLTVTRPLCRLLTMSMDSASVDLTVYYFNRLDVESGSAWPERVFEDASALVSSTRSGSRWYNVRKPDMSIFGGCITCA